MEFYPLWIERKTWCVLNGRQPRSCPRHIGAKECGIAGLIEGSGRKLQNGLCRAFLAGGKTVAVQFQKQDSNNEAGPLVAIDEGMIARDARRVGCRRFDEESSVRFFVSPPIDVRGMSEVLLWAGQGGF